MGDALTVAVAVGAALGEPALCALGEGLGPVPGPQGVRPVVRAALSLPVGPALWVAVEALTGVELSSREWLELVGALQRGKTAWCGGQLAAVVGLAGSMRTDADAGGLRDRWGQRAGVSAVANELAPALALSPSSASRMVALATYADEQLPAALDAVGEGALGQAQLEVLAAVAKTTTPRVRARLEAEAITRCAFSPARLGTHLAALAARCDPAHAAAAAEEGRAARDVRLVPSRTPGCRRLVADLPELHAQAAMHAVAAAARRAADAGVRPDGRAEERTISQLRADYLVGALTHRTATATPEDLAALAEVQVVVGASPPTAGDDGPGDDGGNGLGGDGPGGDGPGRGSGPRPGRPGRDPLPWSSPPLPWQMPLPVPTPPDLTALATVPVVIGLASLTGASEHPASLPGIGPLDAAHTRWIARHARYRWLHVDSATGHLLHREAPSHPPPPRVRASEGRASGGRASGWTADPPDRPPLPAQVSAAIVRAGYVPGRLLRAHVEVRDATCIGPACHHSAHRALGVQLDHTVEWGRRDASGRVGTTSAANLGPACRRVHQAKTHGGWHLAQPTPGTFTWTSLLARTYTRQARPVLPGWHSLPDDQRSPTTSTGQQC